MRRKAPLLLLVGGFLLLGTGTAAAAGSDPGPPATVQFQGQAVVRQGRGQTQLLLSADGGGWHLQATLAPTGLRSREGNDDRRSGDGAAPGRVAGDLVQLVGQFSLDGPGDRSVTGTAAGQIDRGGSGSLELEGDGPSSPLTASFTVAEQGSLTLALSGVSAVGSSPAAGAPAGTAPLNHTFWYVSRAAGLSAYLLLAINVCLGVANRTRFMEALVARWRTFDLHQFTALLALGLLGLHVLALVFDHYFSFTLGQLLVPLASPYRPAWTALGVLGFYLLIAIVGSFYLRRALGWRAWRAIHYLTFVAFALALAHGVLAGTDSGEPWARALYWVTGALVVGLTAWRWRGAEPARPARAANRDLASRSEG